MQLLQKNRCFEGEQRIYQLESQHLKGSSKVGVYLPPAALAGKLVPKKPLPSKHMHNEWLLD